MTVYQIINGGKNINYQLGGNLDLTTSLPLLGKVNLPFGSFGKDQSDTLIRFFQLI